MSKWIKTSDRLPVKHDIVLIWAKGMDDIMTAFLCEEENELEFRVLNDDWHNVKKLFEVTHWMLFPKPPKEDE